MWTNRWDATRAGTGRGVSEVTNLKTWSACSVGDFFVTTWFLLLGKKYHRVNKNMYNFFFCKILRLAAFDTYLYFLSFLFHSNKRHAPRVADIWRHTQGYAMDLWSTNDWKLPGSVRLRSEFLIYIFLFYRFNTINILVRNSTIEEILQKPDSYNGRRTLS